MDEREKASPENMKNAPRDAAGDRTQPDPLLRRGRAGRMWLTVVCITLAAIIAAVVISLWNRNALQNQRQAASGSRALPIGPSKPTQPAQPAGRKSSNNSLSGAGDTVKGQ
jgi:hypothetical protein